MLNLTRKDGEVLVIGDSIRIKFLECRRGRVRVGIEAPKHIHIVREEPRKNPSTREQAVNERSPAVSITGLGGNRSFAPFLAPLELNTAGHKIECGICRHSIRRHEQYIETEDHCYCLACAEFE